tara:strand:+ start:1777 stop:2874 length:1098 start_codon:yes stop_codon:yes gene_type:complete
MIRSKLKESFKILTPIGTAGGFIADILTPLGAVTQLLFFGSLIISLLLLVFHFINRKAESSISKRFLPISIVLAFIFGIFFLLNSNTEKGFLGDNTEIVSNLQNNLFNIEESIDQINQKQTDILDNVKDIKDIISGDSELKNMSNSNDLTVVKELNEKTRNKNAKRVAILYFDNTSGEVKLNKLKKGLAGMLISDLSNVNMLNIVERDRLESIISEQELSNSKKFDPSTAAKLGKLLGAEIILTGSYFEMFGTFRIDARFINVETGEILKSEGVDGASKNFFKLQKQLVWKIIKNLDVKLSPSEKLTIENSTQQLVSYEATLMFSEALDLIDKGKKDKAKDKLNIIIEEFPVFLPAQKELDKLTN